MLNIQKQLNEQANGILGIGPRSRQGRTLLQELYKDGGATNSKHLVEQSKHTHKNKHES